MHYSKILLTFSLSPAFTLVIGAMKKCNNQQSDEGRFIITNCVLLTIKPPRLSAKNVVLKIFSKLILKHMWWILTLKKLQAYSNFT